MIWLSWFVRLFNITDFSNTQNKNILKLAIEEYSPCDKGVDILDYRKCPWKYLKTTGLIAMNLLDINKGNRQTITSSTPLWSTLILCLWPRNVNNISHKTCLGCVYSDNPAHYTCTLLSVSQPPGWRQAPEPTAVLHTWVRAGPSHHLSLSSQIRSTFSSQHFQLLWALSAGYFVLNIYEMHLFNFICDR